MPSENIDRAIERASQAGELDSVVYEAYGPGGVAMVIEGYTDNRNRTAQEIKHLLGKHGVELANPGAASWAFSKVEGKLEPTTTIEVSEADGEKLAPLEEHDDVSEIYTNTA
jgi:transcriptional/translational regulatory protein YebC/TACO1